MVTEVGGKSTGTRLDRLLSKQVLHILRPKFILQLEWEISAFPTLSSVSG